MRAQGELVGADKIADVLNQQQLCSGQVQFDQGITNHRRIKMTHPARVNLVDWNSRTRNSVGVNAAGDVALDNGKLQPARQLGCRSQDDARLASSRRAHKVEAKNTLRIQRLSHLACDLIIGAQNLFSDVNLDHGSFTSHA